MTDTDAFMPPAQPYMHPYQSLPTRKISILGIISFSVSLLAGLWIVGSIAFAVYYVRVHAPASRTSVDNLLGLAVHPPAVSSPCSEFYLALSPSSCPTAEKSSPGSASVLMA